MNPISVTEYDARYKSAFKSLNTEWIGKFFKVEGKDLEQLDHPEACVAEGGQIFFAIRNGEALGTCALYNLGEGRFELAKMGVTATAQGLGLGDLLMRAAETWACTQGAREIMLQSNTVLSPAISLYRKHGYVEVPMRETDYQRANIEMVKKLS